MNREFKLLSTTVHFMYEQVSYNLKTYTDKFSYDAKRSPK